MNKKVLCIVFLILVFLTVLIISPSGKLLRATDVISPNSVVLEGGSKFSFSEFKTFDSFYSKNNSELAKELNISEDEAFLLGNFGKYWAKNLLFSRKVQITENDIIYYRFGYRTRFENSPYCIENNKPANEKAFLRELNKIRKGKFVIVDLDTDKIYPISKQNADFLKNFVVVRRSHIKGAGAGAGAGVGVNNGRNGGISKNMDKSTYPPTIDLKDIKIIVSDSTSKLIPDRNCSSDICREILGNINNTQKTLDIAIYGYSSTPAIENALKSALQRGVNIRLVYDIDLKGGNIYPETNKITQIIKQNKNDKSSAECANTMHNKFYIFDNKVVITGSANLSHTDMSGFNSNAIVVIRSPQIADFYTKEFEQMYSGKFHNDKISTPNKVSDNIQIFFSPQDKGLKNGILPIIRNAKNYIYIPAFVITEKNLTRELINAHNRGVEIKIIEDALNASTKHSKHNEIRKAGIQLKAENYAGKMHSKTIIVDDKYLIIGSMNFSNSGENRNDENFVIIDNPKAAKFYKGFFLYQWSKIPDRWLKSVPRAEGKNSIGSCSDGIDNNYDGFIDAQDPACR